VAAWVVGLAEIHAAAVSVAQLAVEGPVQPDLVRWGVLGNLLSSVVAKSIIAFLSGGKAYGRMVTAGLLTMMVAATLGMLVPVRA